MESQKIESMSKTDLKVIAMLQGHGSLSGAYLKKTVFHGKSQRCDECISKLLKLGLIEKVGITNFAWTNIYPGDL